MRGKVKVVFASKGFGFITPDNGPTDLFFHRRDCDRRLRFDQTLTDRRVEFDASENERGPVAVKVRPVE